MDISMNNQKLAEEFREQLVGKLFRHFKGNIYKVLNIGVDSETAGILVIYCSARDESLVWVRPVEMFTSDVDRIKYPDVAQRLRFEEINNFSTDLLHNFDNQIIHKEKITKKDINIKDIAQEIVDALESRGFNDIKDSSGYYVIKEFEDGTDRAVDVYKSTGDGTEPPHYVIYISHEDDDSDWDHTNDLSVEELEKKLEELSQ